MEDADYAVETSNLTRQQILQQASKVALTQANQLTQNVLALLKEA
ncbi:flagellin [Achromobacter insuavis]